MIWATCITTKKKWTTGLLREISFPVQTFRFHSMSFCENFKVVVSFYWYSTENLDYYMQEMKRLHLSFGGVHFGSSYFEHYVSYFLKYDKYVIHLIKFKNWNDDLLINYLIYLIKLYVLQKFHSKPKRWHYCCRSYWMH